MIEIICAVDNTGVFGYKNPETYNYEMPWGSDACDLSFFQKNTMGQKVVMGSGTYWSLPSNLKTLLGRENIVITKDTTINSAHVRTVKSIEIFLKEAESSKDSKKIFLIGGKTLISYFLKNHPEKISKIHLSNFNTFLASGKNGVALSQEERDKYVFFEEMGNPAAFLKHIKPVLKTQIDMSQVLQIKTFQCN